jgi:hypothetical protein
VKTNLQAGWIRMLFVADLIRNAIAALAERCHGDDRPDCPILDELEATAH